MEDLANKVTGGQVDGGTGNLQALYGSFVRTGRVIGSGQMPDRVNQPDVGNTMRR